MGNNGGVEHWGMLYHLVTTSETLEFELRGLYGNQPSQSMEHCGGLLDT